MNVLTRSQDLNRANLDKGLSVCWQNQPLEMFRASPARNGLYPSKGVPRLSRVRWAFKTWGPVISSPVVVSGWTEMVCFGSWDGKFYAVNSLNGRELWSLWTEGEVVSSPAVESGTVFFGSYDGRVYAAQLLTGDLLWRFRTGNGVASSPLITRTVLSGILIRCTLPFPVSVPLRRQH